MRTTLPSSATDDPPVPPSPDADEESFRLLSGFNDVFVALAIVLFLGAAGWFGFHGAGGGGVLVISALSWLLAEYFTRERRMALPSLVLLLFFALGIVLSGWLLIMSGISGARLTPKGATLAAALTALCCFLAVFAHWRRFRVAISVALMSVAAVACVLSLVRAALPASAHPVLLPSLLGGLALFAFAMRWDSTDLQRRTHRSDVAFWLHLAAAPMIVHPLFRWIGFGFLGLTFGSAAPGVSSALLGVGIYLVLGAVALVIDRRAVLVSALVYVISAVALLLRQAGSDRSSLAFTALAIGGLLLVLSAFWRPLRRALLLRLPPGARRRLPQAT